MLLEMPAFDLLTEKLREMRDGTIAAGVASMKAIFKKAEDILTEYARENPGDRRKMQQAISDIRAIQPASAYEVDTTSAETLFRKIMQDFRAGSKAYVGTIDKLTTEIMPRIVTSLRKQTNHPEKLRGFTPEMMTDAIMEQRDTVTPRCLPIMPDSIIVLRNRSVSQLMPWHHFDITSRHHS